MHYKTDNKNYVKDENGFVINTNNAELNSYLEKRERIKQTREQENRLNALEEQIENVNTKLDLILGKLIND